MRRVRGVIHTIVKLLHEAVHYRLRSSNEPVNTLTYTISNLLVSQYRVYYIISNYIMYNVTKILIHMLFTLKNLLSYVLDIL